uniref:Uncharacterized protein n=1 Tax=Glossina austeni TaxID=7395 RepID=A0A1A9VEF9_GLOAU
MAEIIAPALSLNDLLIFFSFFIIARTLRLCGLRGNVTYGYNIVNVIRLRSTCSWASQLTATDDEYNENLMLHDTVGIIKWALVVAFLYRLSGNRYSKSQLLRGWSGS